MHLHHLPIDSPVYDGVQERNAELWPDEGLDLVLSYFPKNTAPPANTYIALFTNYSSSGVGSNSNGMASYTEPSGGAYARVAVSSASWGAPSTNAPGRKVSTTVQFTFATATAAWGTCNGFVLSNASTNGSAYYAANFDDTQPVNIQASDVIRVTPSVQYNQ